MVVIISEVVFIACLSHIDTSLLEGRFHPANQGEGQKIVDPFGARPLHSGDHAG